MITIFQDEAWNQRCKVFSDDIDRKLDRLELKSLIMHIDFFILYFKFRVFSKNNLQNKFNYIYIIFITVLALTQYQYIQALIDFIFIFRLVPSSMSSVSSEVDKADGTEVDVVTHCDELQVDISSIGRIHL
jgi:poly-beta-hydroxyalkanoate depolymerase